MRSIAGTLLFVLAITCCSCLPPGHKVVFSNLSQPQRVTLRASSDSAHVVEIVIRCRGVIEGTGELVLLDSDSARPYHTERLHGKIVSDKVRLDWYSQSATSEFRPGGNATGSVELECWFHEL